MLGCLMVVLRTLACWASIVFVILFRTSSEVSHVRVDIGF